MKKLLYSSLVLTIFSLSLILFQISCKEEVIAKEAEVQNKFLYHIYNMSTHKSEFWISDIDGTNRKQIPVTPSSGETLVADAKLTPDGKSLIFATFKAGYVHVYYSISIDGTNLKKLFEGSGDSPKVNQTY